MFGTIDKLYGGICTMKWDKYTIETTTEAEDYISCTLADLGIEGNYEGIGHCAIGYAAASANAPAPRKENYVYYVK